MSFIPLSNFLTAFPSGFPAVEPKASSAVVTSVTKCPEAYSQCKIIYQMTHDRHFLVKIGVIVLDLQEKVHQLPRQKQGLSPSPYCAHQPPGMSQIVTQSKF
jgi:hypothetical protein